MKKEVSFQKKLYISVIAALILLSIKTILTDFDYDAEYALVMGYRMAKGDKMFLQMWESHLTSAFLCAALVKIYLAITGTTTGIVLYVQTCCVLIRALLALLLNKTLKRYIEPTWAFLLSCLFFAVTPKDLPIAEFANMQFWFQTALFCMLLWYLETKKKPYLILASICLCLEIITYPSCIIIFFPVVALLFVYSKEKWKDIAIVSLSCFIQGVVYVGYFVVTIGLELFLTNCEIILTGDVYHTKGIGEKFLVYGSDLLKVMAALAVLLLVCAAVGKIYCMLVHKNTKKDVVQSSLYLYFAVMLVGLFVYTLWVKGRTEQLVIYIPMFILGGFGRHLLSDAEKRVYDCGMAINVCSFFAVLALTDLTVLDTINYLLLAVIVTLIPIKAVIDEYVGCQKAYKKYSLIFAFLLLSLFRSAFLIRPMYYHLRSVLNIEGIVKSGPAVGIMSEYIGPYTVNTAMEEWDQYIEEGDRLLLVGSDFGTHTIGYLYKDVVIANSSTLSTPTFDENLLTYWEQNPDKYPNVVAVECWYGDLSISEDSFIYQWIINDFQPTDYADGKYWRYYWKK